ncbi:MAG TPA: sulfatase [Tepidisphaeraceae bacterium]|jgi:arylsulfatase A-like enzyme|nr:sulfatase [Tepidisphaeraceae bacterium]
MLNIVYLHSHDTGRWVSPYGYPHATPNFERLATSGILFENAYTPSPTCSPSRACLLTGQMPRKNGMIGLAHRGSRLADPDRHLAALLRGRGYRTALSGMQHEFAGDQHRAMPYDEVLERVGVDDVATQDPAIARAAAAYIERKHNRPFFLSCGFFTTHRTAGHESQAFNAAASPLGDPSGVRVPPEWPDTPAVRADIADYNVALDRLDACVGIVLDALDAAGRAGDTLVICTTDHGVPFPGHKSRLTDAGAGVLLILRGPGGLTGGRRIAPLVTHLDVLPTILAMLGEVPDAVLDGKSLLPLLAGETDKLHDVVFGEVNYHAAYEPMRSVRTAAHLYVRRFDRSRRRVLPNCDPGPTRTAMTARGWADDPEPTEALYDLAVDPRQTRNLIDDPAAAPIATILRDRLAQNVRATADPLLILGHVPHWPGMKTTPATATYPGDPVVPAESLFTIRKATP